MPKYVILLTALVAGCSRGPAPKEFFDSVCKNYKMDSTLIPKVELENDTDEVKDNQENEPRIADYDSRCTEKDKKQIIADDHANFFVKMANEARKEGKGPTPAEIQVSLEKASDDCISDRACSGLPLVVAIPPGSDLYNCGFLNGKNWVSIVCSEAK